MPYQARSQNLFGNVGGPTAPVQPVDIPGAIDAVTSGATSLIHATMLRKAAEFERARQGQELDIQRQREGREADQQQWQRNFETTKANRDFIVAGGIPAHDETTPASTQNITMRPPTPRNRIADAMKPTVGATDVPGTSIKAPALSASITPSAPPSEPVTAPIKVPGTSEHMPDMYDPSKGAAYQRMQMQQILRNEGYMTREEYKGDNARELLQMRLDAQQKGREFMDKAHQGWIKLTAQAKSGSGIRGAMTGNQREQYFEKVVAPGLLQQYANEHDTYGINGALEALNDGSDQSKALIADGFTTNHLLSVASKMAQERAKGSLPLERGLMGSQPGDAAGKVGATYRATAPQITTPKPRTGGATVTGKDATVPNPGGATLSKSTKEVTVPKEPDFTDAEIDEALKAGNTADEDVAKYITTKRKTKKPTLSTKK